MRRAPPGVRVILGLGKRVRLALLESVKPGLPERPDPRAIPGPGKRGPPGRQALVKLGLPEPLARRVTPEWARLGLQERRVRPAQPELEIPG